MQKKTINFFMNIANMMDIKSTINRKRASRGDFKDYTNISKKYKIYNNEWYFPNNFYGISNNLYIYSNQYTPIKACIEHGMVIGNNASKFEIYNPILQSIITMSEYRKIYLEKVSDKIILKIGPYIHYASDFYNEKQFYEEKNKIEKNLLVFPSHSIENIYSDYDFDEFIKEIKRIAEIKNIKSINICMYWNDINRGVYKKYKENGFNIVTAGYREDPMFLSRLKTIIKLSDYTMSNSVGTHVGYCIYLKKPHYIMRQNIDSIIKKHIEVNQNNKPHVSEFLSKDIVSYRKDVDEILKYFEKPLFEISEEQKEVCNRYWGFDEIKTPKQINDIIKFCEYIFQEKKQKNQNMNLILKNYIINNKIDNIIKLIIEEQMDRYEF